MVEAYDDVAPECTERYVLRLLQPLLGPLQSGFMRRFVAGHAAGLGFSDKLPGSRHPFKHIGASGPTCRCGFALTVCLGGIHAHDDYRRACHAVDGEIHDILSGLVRSERECAGIAVGRPTVDRPFKGRGIEPADYGAQHHGPSCKCIADGGGHEVRLRGEFEGERKPVEYAYRKGACIGAVGIGSDDGHRIVAGIFGNEMQRASGSIALAVDRPDNGKFRIVGVGYFGRKHIAAAEPDQQFIVGKRQRDVGNAGLEHVDTDFFGSASVGGGYGEVDIIFSGFIPRGGKGRFGAAKHPVDFPAERGSLGVLVCGRDRERVPCLYFVDGGRIVEENARRHSGSHDIVLIAGRKHPSGPEDRKDAKV